MRGIACLVYLAGVLALPAQAQLLDFKSGHLKGQYLLGTYPDDSLLRDLLGTPTHDLNSDLRLLAAGNRGRWSWQADYQAILRSGDTLELDQALGDNFLVPGAVPDDDRRLMDLTHVISENGDRVLAHRLDRLHLGYTGDKTVLRIGRQAVSWGNGLIYNPVDFFNPFDPAAVDREYKSGDDLLYGQYLQDNGNDWQLVHVWRRNDDGDVDRGVNTSALKYHAFVGAQELDILLARHYEDDIATLGGITSLGGAILRGDLVITDTENDTYISAVANYSYSWTAWNRNMSGIVEYFYNDMGLREEDYDELPRQADLLDRLTRGELFTIGRHYLAGGVTVEMTPLINLTPNAFVNLGDGSGLAQIVLNWDLEQNLQLIAALNLPFGSKGSEFGGLDSGVDDLQLSSGPALFAQLALYF